MLEKAFSELFCNFQGILALKNLSCRLKRLIEEAIRAKKSHGRGRILGFYGDDGRR